jgi:hypothetical protein
VPQQCVILSVCPSRSASYKLKMIVDELKLKSCSVSEGKLGRIVNYVVRCMGSNTSQFLYLLRHDALPRAVSSVAACFMLVSSLVYSSTLKTEVTWSSEMSINFHRTPWHYIPKDTTPHNHCLKNPKSNNFSITIGGAVTRKRVVTD